MTFKANQPVTVQVSRGVFEDGKFLRLMSNGRVKVLFPAADPKKNPEGEWDIYPATRVKPALPKKTKARVVKDALTRVQEKSGRDPSENVGAWDSNEIRKAVAAFGKRAKMTGKPYHEIRNAYEAKNGPIPKPSASEIAAINRANRAAEDAIMNAAENNERAKRGKGKLHPAIKAVEFTSAGASTHHLHTIRAAALLWVIKRLRSHVVYVCNGKLGCWGPRGVGKTDTPASLAKMEEWKKEVVAKAPGAIFLNGMNDVSLLSTLANKVYRIGG